MRSASAAGFNLVSLAVQPPYVYPEPVVTPEAFNRCAEALEETGIQVGSLEFFILSDYETTESYRSALEIGARLGGKTAVALDLINTSADEAGERLAHFAAVAGDYGLGVNLEPVFGGQSQTLEQGSKLIRNSGANVGLVLDALHLIRTGGTAEDLKITEKGLIRYIQICDGPATITPEVIHSEAVAERQYPGDGNFPLEDILRACPQDIPIAIEAPSISRLQKGISFEDQAREAMGAMKALLSRSGLSQVVRTI